MPDFADIDKTIQGSVGETAPLGRIDKYELVRELGEGGFGAVYLARDTVAGVDVAIKGLPPEVKHNESELEPIRANFALVSRLRHPNIVGLRDLHRAERVSYASKEVEEKLRVFERDTMVVMDYAPGATLAKWRKQFPDAKVPLDRAIEIARQIASALDAAHAYKVLHRDVKPENVMVETRENGAPVARVLDFGLAAEIRSSMGRVSRKILDTSGTRPYMAPEQWLGEEQNAATDQYALAVLFYELVTGKTPFASVFDCGDTAVMRLAVTTDAPKIPASFPKNMRKALVVALSKKPEERFASCGDFVAALEGKRVSRRGAETQRKSGVGKVLGLLALLAVLAAGVWRFAGRDAASAGHGQPVEPPPLSVPPTPAAPPAHVQPPVVANGENAEREAKEARERAAEFIRLKTRINIKVSDAREKLKRIDAFRADQDGLASHIESADGQKKMLDALATPGSLEEAVAAFDIADKAEAQISLDFDWLAKNKAGRDSSRKARTDIQTLLDGDVAAFKAAKYASTEYRRGEELRVEGEKSFRSGDFETAGRRLADAVAAYAAAVRKSRKFHIDTTLDSAKDYFKAKKWEQCIGECDKVLGWDDANADAKKLKAEAESNLVPSAKAIARIGDREVAGATFKIGGREYSAPVWKTLTAGRNLMDGDAEVEYSESGKRYTGVLKNRRVDWRGPKTFTVALKEYTGPSDGEHRWFTLPGGVKMEMVYVAASRRPFKMGSENGDGDEKPVHDVRLTKGFWIGKHPVTQSQWKALVSANGISFDKGSPSPWFSSTGGGRDCVAGLDTSDFPMESISWNDCDALVRTLNRNATDGRTYALPTEAQWEFAARGGNKSRGYAYSGGNDMNSLGWYYENSGIRRLSDSDWKVENLKSNKCRTHSVREKDIGNELGIVGMSGNVWEWCQDWYDKDYYANSSQGDPTGPASGTLRVLRGGCWYYFARHCRSARRDWFVPDYRSFIIGFRLCCSAGPRE